MHTDIQTDRAAYRHTDIQTYRHTDIQTYRKTCVQTYRQTNRHTDRHTDIQTYRHTDRRNNRHADRHAYKSGWRPHQTPGSETVMKPWEHGAERARVMYTSHTCLQLLGSSCFVSRFSQANMALSKHTCYELEFKDQWGHQKIYHGTTEVLPHQTPTEACGVRLRHHKSKPLQCLLSCVWDTAKIQPCGRTLSLANALAQEAIKTARALIDDTTTRGACYSCKELNGFLRNSACMVRRTVGKLEGQAARDAVTR